MATGSGARIVDARSCGAKRIHPSNLSLAGARALAEKGTAIPFTIYSACILIKFYPCPDSIHSSVEGFVDNSIKSP
jgi:hypothetical protein